MALSKTEGSYQDYAYTGGIQSVKLTNKGLYKLECWGAGGRAWNSDGGKGGYAVGYINVTADRTVYICVGGTGKANSTEGGYNGGGDGTSRRAANGYACGGGGATHMATASGTIKALGSKSKLLLVAGGGGGGRAYTEGDNISPHAGGDGGGEEGGGAIIHVGQTTLRMSCATQTAGGATDSDLYEQLPTLDLIPGSFGQGGTGTTEGRCLHSGDAYGGGGGGGLYGGAGGGCYMFNSAAGGGGSGYTGGVPTVTFDGKAYAPGMTNGGGSAMNTNGKARITFVKADTIPVIFDGTRLKKLFYNGTQATGLVYNGTRIFARA